MKDKVTFGSICSGIEASQLAFSNFSFRQIWSSEIADFPNRVLAHHYPNITNIGNMNSAVDLILNNTIDAPDLLCGGTPCQAFSLAGWKNGLSDERGKLTMKFIEIANAIDITRERKGKKPTIILWENVEGVLNDKSNAFGNFIAGLAGFNEEIKVTKWTKSGYLKGPTRNVAWRVLDAKYFGLPQQRKRLYVIASGNEFNPDQILFEYSVSKINLKSQNKDSDKNLFNLFNSLDKFTENIFYKENNKFEYFRNYTDCLYSAYGTKWNGNAAAYNGSLYISQNDRIRRFTPLECERLMGIPDNYTKIDGNSDTNRYQAIGNSWAVPVIKWIAGNINKYLSNNRQSTNLFKNFKISKNSINAELYLLNDIQLLNCGKYLNTSVSPNISYHGNIEDIVQTQDVSEKFYLSSQACKGILRRKTENNLKMNTRLEDLMFSISVNIDKKAI